MTGAPPSLFPLVYALNGGRPAVDVSFTVEADGSCLVDVFTGDSLGQDSPIRLGTFAGHLPPETLAALVRWAESAVLDGQGLQPPGTVSRFLGRAGEAARPVGGEPPTSVEAALAEAARAALDSPRRAIEVAATAEPDGARARLLILSIGRDSFRLLLFDRRDAGYWPRLWRDDPEAQGGGIFVAYEEIEALANEGAIKEGVVELMPGESLSLPLPAGSHGRPAGGNFIFWRAGQGPERHILAGSWSLPGA